MPGLPPEILDEATVLFEDVRLGDVDPEAHAAFVIARVLDRGTMRSVVLALTSNRGNRDSPSAGWSFVVPRTTEVVARVVVAPSDRRRNGQVGAT